MTQPSALLGSPALPPRFWSKVSPQPNGCWFWTAYLRHGYGYFGASKGTSIAHRASYIALTGPVPDGLVLDHLCRNKQCVNPEHLEPVTQRENLRRGKTVNARGMSRTHCPKNHPYDDTNTIRRSDGSRKCRTCQNAMNRAWRAKRAAADLND